MADIRRQELHCHACNNYVQFDIDLEMDGNHVLECPNCGHEHCRVVKEGIITGERWAQRNGNTIYVSTTTTSWSSSSTSTIMDINLWQSWASSSSNSGYATSGTTSWST